MSPSESESDNRPANFPPALLFAFDGTTVAAAAADAVEEEDEEDDDDLSFFPSGACLSERLSGPPSRFWLIMTIMIITIAITIVRQ